MIPYFLVTQNTYDKLAERYRNTRGNLIMYDVIEKFENMMVGKDLLEIGSGPGRDARVFVDRGYHVTGLDFSEGLTKIAREFVPEATFVVADMYDLPFEDSSFDGVWSCATLHHLTKMDLPHVLAEIYRVLRPGAPGYISVKQGEGERVEYEKEFDEMGRFFSYYQEGEFRTYLEKAGFEIVDTNVERTGDRFGDEHPNPNHVFVNAFVRKPG